MKLYQPSNGTEGMVFTEKFCDTCIFWNDKEIRGTPIGCPIQFGTVIYDIGDDEYPNQWRYKEDGVTPVCLCYFGK